MPRRVLLWCSEAATVRTLHNVLTELNLSVEHCASTEEAENRLRDQRFDAVIVDLDDNDADAPDVLQRARNSALNHSTLAITIVASGVNVRDIFALGANFLLYKPVSAERVRASLRAAYALMGRERRRNVRLPVHSKAKIDHAGLENGEATIIDLSEEGTAIQSERRMPPSCKVYFKFELPDQPSVVRLSAEVVWQDSTGRVGMRFVDVPQGSRRLLREWLAAAFVRAQASLKASTPAPVAPTRLAPPFANRTSETTADDGLARFRASPGNRRNQSRRACQIGAEVYKANSDVPHRCTLSDISLGGCYVELPSPFPSGSKVDVQLRTRDIKLRVPGVVLSIHPGFGMGIQFELRNPEQKEHLQRLVHQLAEIQGLEYGTPASPMDR